MNESITKATLGIEFVIGDLRAAREMAFRVTRPEGKTLADKVLAAYFAECEMMAAKLQDMLLKICD